MQNKIFYEQIVNWKQREQQDLEIRKKQVLETINFHKSEATEVLITDHSDGISETCITEIAVGDPFIDYIEVIHDYYPNNQIKQITHCKNGYLHCATGPAITQYFPNYIKQQESYIQNDKYHREDGPAIISYNPSGNVSSSEYWIDDKRLTEFQFQVHQRTQKLKGLFNKAPQQEIGINAK